MACSLSSHVRAFSRAFPHLFPGKTQGYKGALSARSALEINGKFRVANGFTQLVSNICTVNMKCKM